LNSSKRRNENLAHERDTCGVRALHPRPEGRGFPRIPIKTDQRLLIRILRNLPSNAFRYTLSGRVLLALRARRDSLRIEVWDTGVSIDESKLKDIFTEFHQLLPQGTGGRQGAGLGLAIVERMVAVLGYRIDVVSRPGRGSRFALVLPVDMQSARRAALPAALITADRGDELRTLMRAQGLQILNKPVKPNRLRALLTSLLSAK
jgi:signal transduction histidine kinase